MKIRWSPPAANDLERIAAYIHERKPDAAIRIALDIHRTCELLIKSPALGRPGSNEGTRELVISSYIVVYRILEKQIEVVRIHHSAQNWQ